MFTSYPDYLRQQAITHLFKMKTFSSCWRTWKEEIREMLGNNITPTKIIDLGDNLSRIFSTTGVSGRAQSDVSKGGAAWEALICWYLNICTAGSRIVILKKMSLVPIPIKNALTVTYGNYPCNTESDLVVIVFPNDSNYTIEKDHILVRNENGIEIPTTLKKGYNLTAISNELCVRDFEKYEIGIVQCKTNWNDNAQIPMLWDMIYSVKDFKDKRIAVGTQSYHIGDLRKFTYSFATVPSNKKANYKSDSVAVKRVSNLTGGNYWGKPSDTVASSIKEIFNRNFQDGFSKNIRLDLERAIPHFNGELKYFDII